MRMLKWEIQMKRCKLVIYTAIKSRGTIWMSYCCASLQAWQYLHSFCTTTQLLELPNSFTIRPYIRIKNQNHRYFHRRYCYFQRGGWFQISSRKVPESYRKSMQQNLIIYIFLLECRILVTHLKIPLAINRRRIPFEYEEKIFTYWTLWYIKIKGPYREKNGRIRYQIQKTQFVLYSSSSYLLRREDVISRFAISSLLVYKWLLSIFSC